VLGRRAEDALRLSMIGAGGDLRAFWSNGLVGTVTTLGPGPVVLDRQCVRQNEGIGHHQNAGGIGFIVCTIP
jgi:TctA family transporter